MDKIYLLSFTEDHEVDTPIAVSQTTDILEKRASKEALDKLYIKVKSVELIWGGANDVLTAQITEIIGYKIEPIDFYVDQL